MLEDKLRSPETSAKGNPELCIEFPLDLKGLTINNTVANIESGLILIGENNLSQEQLIFQKNN